MIHQTYYRNQKYIFYSSFHRVKIGGDVAFSSEKTLSTSEFDLYFMPYISNTMKKPAPKKWFVFLVLSVPFFLVLVGMSKSESLRLNHIAGSSLDSLWQGSNGHFLSAGTCDHCHGFDSSGVYNVDMEGGDINVVDDWRSTMMANSSRDPYWRAKISHEVLVNPAHQGELEGFCTKCHAPAGRYNAHLNGASEYSMTEMLADNTALDGVNCMVCHRQSPPSGAPQHSGVLNYRTDSIIEYGPYVSPLVSPMAEALQSIPVFGSHVTASSECAGCHSLITPTIDLTGNATGDEFVEQATWHEWLNSSYSAENVTCQQCHMPRLTNQAVRIANGYPTQPRSEFGLHTLVGGNALMLRMMRDHNEQLGIAASDDDFNRTIAATENMLQQQSIQLEWEETNRTADTLYVAVKVKNLAGHKLPSGYPARRVSLHLQCNDDLGNVIFNSGSFDSEGATPEENIDWEPHYNIIDNESQVQIYEMIMGDVNGQRTSVLARGAMHLKDNRLTPRGMQATGAMYDTTEVVLGLTDNDFNLSDGSDVVHYHIPVVNYSSALSVHVAAYYQSIHPSWLAELLADDTPEIQTFSAMLDATDKTPILMKQLSIDVPAIVGVRENRSANFKVVAMKGGLLQCNTLMDGELKIYDSTGKFVDSYPLKAGKSQITHTLSLGAYIAVMRCPSGDRMQRFVISNP